ncbi:RNA-directed DNA polymerase, eukaryota, reverse transcriptase zinc-binding domain protein [Tanacetum coccineum]
MTNTSKQDEVKLLIREEKVSMCAVIETQVSKKFVNQVGDNIFGNWNWVSNSVDSNRGCRIMVGWDRNIVGANLISQTDQVMHFEVNFSHDHRKQFVSFVYAKNFERDRKPLWRNLSEHNMLVSNEPWVVLGDFNVIMNTDECSNSFNIVDRDMDVFRRVLHSLELEDIVSYGMFYTWIQKRRNPEAGFLKKLDRVLGNASFLSSYASCFAKFLPYMTSDHCPAIIVYPDVKGFKPRSFRFMNFLTDKPEFLPTVKDNWYSEVHGFYMFVLAKRLKNMKKHLRNMNRLNGNVFDKVKVLREELKRVQNCLDKDPDCVHLREEEYVFCNAYKEAARDEEMVLRQKTKIQWLKDGDQNSAYFHNSLKGRMFRSRIEVVYDSEGHKYEGDDIATKFVDHFSKFLGTEDDVFPIEDPDSLFINKLDAQCSDYMVRPVLDDEIKFAMFSIEDDKAAGPDGYTSKFFKTAWNIVGGDVCAAVKEFFYSSKLLGEFNANLISLVPKLQTPLKITDYRPIACCNVVYKCISKVITNRLKEGLGSIIDSNQSAFIPGRQISDNIFLAQEFMHGYGRKGGAQRCAFKVDIEKAYDTVNWDFLKIALQRFGFHSSMIKWIMVCLTTASFSICVNGETHGFFKGKRGLRQGDPMSPYLFTIVMEVLNLMIKRQIRLDSRFRYHWGCSKINLTHLCFADDLLMLCHGDLISASILRRALDEFSMTSGLYPSMAKSTVFYSNVPGDVKEDIRLAMPFREGELPVRYLGVPLTSKMLSIADCKVLVEKVKKRIFDWRNKSLSFAGKLQLVASVLSSLHVYWASMFMLPVSICDSIDKLFKNFIWGKSESSSGIASVSWKDVCRPKNQGGLGLKSLRVMNCALMVKHLWYIASRKESLWVKWLNVYKLKGECLWDMKVRDSFSWNLKQILKLRDSVRKFVGYKIGNGIDCFVWYDRWHSNGPLCRLISNHIISSCGFDLNAKVADLICENNWIWPIEWSELFSEVIDVPVPVLSSDSVDKALWFNKKNEEVQFSVKEAWKVLRIDGPEVMWHKHVWFSQCIPRHAFILWMALKGRLKTQDRISRWIGADNMVCPFCKSCKDSHSHLFFQCGFAQGVWDRLKLMCRLEDLSYVWAEIVSGISVRKANNTLWSIIQRLVFGAAVYFIWQERNFRLFRSVERPADKVFDIIVDTVRLRLLGLKIKRSHEVEKAAAIWKIPIKGVGEKSGYGVKYGVNDDVLYGAFLGLELWIIAWERRLLFSVLVLVITPCFGEVGWGGFGFHIWDGVIRECRDMQGSGGIRGVRLCSDKRRLSCFPFVDSGFVRISPWEGCKPGLDVSLWSIGLNWCHACLFTYILKVGCIFFWDRIGLGILGCTPKINKGLGYKMDSEYKVLVQVCKMLMKYKDFCLKIGPSLLSAEELQVIFFCWIECMVQLVIC